MFFVEIQWTNGEWFRLASYPKRDDAEWQIATWRTKNGSNGKDTGFRVVEMPESDSTLNRDALKHFVDLAVCGKRGTASSGEKKARRLAEHILDDAPGLDQNALDGLGEFARVVSANYTLARDLIR